MNLSLVLAIAILGLIFIAIMTDTKQGKTELNVGLGILFVVMLISSWFGFACLKPFSIEKVEELPIETITLKNGFSYQWVSTGPNAGINITEKWGIIIPEGNSKIVVKHRNLWVNGIHFSTHSNEEYYLMIDGEIVENSMKTKNSP